jgi:hypothetical protein
MLLEIALGQVTIGFCDSHDLDVSKIALPAEDPVYVCMGQADDADSDWLWFLGVLRLGKRKESDE